MQAKNDNVETVQRTDHPLITVRAHQRNTQFNFLSQTDHSAVAHIFDITLEDFCEIMILFKNVKAPSTPIGQASKRRLRQK